MKMGVARVKALAGLFLEGLMLVFIFVCSQADFTAENTADADEPAGKFSYFHQVAVRTTLYTESGFHTFSRNAIAVGEFIIPIIKIPALKQVVDQALLISPYERNSFYVLLRDKAP